MRRVALGVDLAAVELGALVLVAEQVVGARRRREFLGRLRIVLVAIGMQLLGELAIGLLDLGLARAAGYTECRIGVCCHGLRVVYHAP
jgi:hypothetical protein